MAALFFMATLSACDAEPICEDRVVIQPQSLTSLKVGDSVYSVADVEAELQRLELACGGKLMVFFVINPELPFEEQDKISDDIVASDAVYVVSVAIATLKQNP